MTPCPILSIIVVFLFCCMSGFSQSGGKGVVELNGQVSSAADGAPVIRALVQVFNLNVETSDETKSSTPKPSPVFTDASGAFHFSGLPAGTFNIIVTRPQFQSATETVQSESGAKSVQIKLTRLGVVTGTITDADGKPVPGVNVIMYQTPIVQGRRTLSQSRNVITDDLGQYRLWNIEPGKYVLKAAGRGRGTMLYSSEASPSFSAAESFVPVFFGGAPDWRTARPIDVQSGSEVTANFRLSLQPVRKIRGAVTGMTLFRSANFQLFDKQENLVSSRAALSGAGGGFQLLDVLPGAYIVRGTQGTGDAEVFGETEVTVGDADVDGVNISLRPGVKVSVKSNCEVSTMEGQRTCGYLTLYRSDGQMIPLRGNRELAYPNLAAGQYEFDAGAINAYVTSVLVGGQVVRPGEKLRISEGMGPVEIQASQEGGTIEVKVELRDGPPPPELRFLVVSTSENYSGPVVLFPGASQFEKHAPGDYVIYCLRSSDMGELEYRNAEALRALTPSATVRVEPNGHHTVTIRSLSK